MLTVGRVVMKRRFIGGLDRFRALRDLKVLPVATIVALVVLWTTPATAEGAPAPEWTFQPVAMGLPEALADGEIVGVGPHGVYVVQLVLPGLSYHLVAHGQSQQMFASGDEAPGGGTFSHLRDMLVVSAEVVILAATVSGSVEERYFRWESGMMTHLPVPAGVTWMLDRHDGQGNFLAWRVLDSTHAEAWITDGQQDGPAISLAWGEDEFESPAGITADGSFLIHGSSQGVNFYSTSVYFRGNRTDILATAHLDVDGELQQGAEVFAFALNSAGDVLVHRQESPSGIRTLFLHRPGTPGEVVAQTGDFYSFFSQHRSRISSHPQLFIDAQTAAGPGLFTGPSGEADRLGGDFSAFNQSGQVLSFATRGLQQLPIFHETGVALFRIQLADQTIVTAIGTAALPEISTWTNPAGGDWDEPSNWDRLVVPGSGAETLFDLDASYDVVVGARQSGRSRVEAGGVAFRNADLELIGALSIGGAANLSLPEGRLVADRVVIGHLPSDDEPLPMARLFVANADTELRTTASFTIGGDGRGDLLISDATVVSAEVLIGRTLEGSVAVTGGQAFWSIASLGLGLGGDGSLVVERGASLSTDDAVIGLGGGGNPLADGSVVIDGAGQESPRARWTTHDLTIGGGNSGSLEVIAGGSVLATGLVEVGNVAVLPGDLGGRIRIYGAADQSAPSRFRAFGEVLCGGVDGASALIMIADGGEATVSGDLYLGYEEGSFGNLLVEGVDPSGTRSQLTVSGEPGQGITLRVGYHGLGQVTIAEGGRLECDNLLIGGQTNSSGTVVVQGSGGGESSELLVTGARFAVGGVTGLGSIDGVEGRLQLSDGVVRMTGVPNEIWIGTGGFLIGHGTVVVNQVVANGYVDPYFLPSVPAGKTVDAEQPGTLTLDADVEFGSTAVVRLDLWGVDPGLQDHLEITGAATLGGTLELRFGNDYAPQEGDELMFLSAGGGLIGSFDEVVIVGLEEGFEFELDFSGGQIVLIALNDATVGIQSEPGQPLPDPVPVITTLRLYPNQPNPFNPQTVLVYEVPQPGVVRLEVFDLRGRLVRTLVDEARTAGRHEVLWDGRDTQGREQPSGVYLSRLRADGREAVGRMTLVR